MSDLERSKPDNMPERHSLMPSIGKWKHPDPRLASIVLNATMLSLPASKIAEIVCVDLRTLKQFYDNELSHGRTFVSLRLLDTAEQMALSGNDKMMIYMMKNWVEPHAAQQAKAETPEDSMADKNGLMLENLSVDELKEFRRLINKAKPAVESDVKENA